MRRIEGLDVKPAPRKARRRGTSSSPAVAADRPNAVWCWDFIFDRTEGGRTPKILSLIDEYSRFCVRLRVEAFDAFDAFLELYKAKYPRKPATACPRTARPW